jgi:probable rRNA maturation factor
MRRKVINKGKFTITLHDNARETKWGWNKVARVVEDVLPILEDFAYSKETIIDKKKNDSIALDVTFYGDKKVRMINREHRNKDKTTDVLSFPMFESLRQGSDDFVFPGEVHLGDIVISRDVAKRQAKEFGIRVEEEVVHLLVHGFLHLQGWDHEISQKEEEIMEAHEQKILKKLAKKRGK